jgi:hypothetical protein
MAYDLFLGKTKSNFARDLGTPSPLSDEVTFVYSPQEQAMLAQISELRMKTDSGDKTSKKKLVTIAKNVAKLKARARKGDEKAKRTLLVLRESGVFKPMQTFALGWSLFAKPDPAERKATIEKFVASLKSASKPEDIAKLSELATYDQAIKNKLGELARGGNETALRVAAYKKSSSAGSDSKAEAIRKEVQRLLQKRPRTAEENATLERLTEKLTRIEAMSGIGASPWQSQKRAARRARRAQKLASLKARAAAGDQRAIARLQQMQQQLNQSLPAAVATAANPLAYAPPTALSPSAPSALPSTSYPYPSSSYPSSSYPSSAYQTPAYQPPYVPPYYQDADGNYYQTQPQPGQSQPTVDVFVGQRSRRRAEEAAAEQEDRGNVGWSGGSFVGAAVCGNAIPHDNYRVAVMKAAVKSAQGKRPSTKDYFAAKSAVDKVIGKSGITIYMPGAKPGRRTI